MEPGYYLVIDEINGDRHGDAVSDFIVEIVGNATFTPKSTEVPTFDKIIDDAEPPVIEDIEDGGTYDPGVVINVKPDEELFIDGELVVSPAVLDEVGEHEITVKKINGGTSTAIVTIAPKHVHDYTEEITKEPDCINDGEKMLSCDCGDTYTETINALGHSFGDVTGDATFKWTEVTGSTWYRYGTTQNTSFPLTTYYLLGYSGDGVKHTTYVYVTCAEESTIRVYIRPFQNTSGLTTCSNLSFYDKTHARSLCYGSKSINTFVLPEGTTQIAVELNKDTTGASWAMEVVAERKCTRCGMAEADAVASAWIDSVGDILFPSAMAVEDNGEVSEGIGGDTGTETEKSDEIGNTDTTVNYGIGDSIPFRLTATMPESISAYDEYKVIFHDTLSDGMTYDGDSMKVFAGGIEIEPDNYAVSFDGQSFTVAIDDVKADPFNASAGSEISVKYSATLNDGAVFGNTNDAYLEYSNNPNGDGTGRTVSDTVTAFTFSVRFGKVDGKTGNPLDGAGFTLYKKNTDGEYDIARNEIVGTTAFEFTGLAAGSYKLVESTTPDGYNTMEDREFSIIAESTEDADGTAHVTLLKIVGQDGNAEGGNLDGWIDSVDDGSLGSDIANFKGNELPSTGGIGTTVFYAVGGTIVFAACILLVVKRKEKASC